MTDEIVNVLALAVNQGIFTTFQHYHKIFL